VVKGLDVFREHFRDYADCYVVIGGVACDGWFGDQGLEFRATRDVDMVLLVDDARPDFAGHFWAFVTGHGYTAHALQDGTSTRYRFVNPETPDVPVMIELFAAAPVDFELREGQHIIPIAGADLIASLSAILMDRDYFELIRSSTQVRRGLPMAGAGALIPLKAKAYLDLSERRARGESVDGRDIRKHRNDAFQLAATLPGAPGQELPDTIRADLSTFLDRHPGDSDQWPAILGSARNVLGGAVPSPAELNDAIRTYFGL